MYLLQKDNKTLIHLFWECEQTHAFWLSLEGLVHSTNTIDKNKTRDKLDVLGLNSGPEHSLFNCCKLYARCYIYTCKNKDKNPKCIDFKQHLKYYMSIEKEILPSKKYYDKWRLLTPILDIQTEYRFFVL